ncbi:MULTISPECIES: oligoribonuclease [Idiomarinaceae]|uniref:Oligoribonuclease n=4 Tax=Pseudidiomarina TaxID=2800384 RepID=A0A368UXU2_9GAMM|nr:MULTISPECIES: oligoribonuclease [Idiomarinaceae]MDT7526688.1 oligoribonuclease [Pseudidiomarina sp. GXY010]MDX1525935.1 oligoribonuclease [Pseudidiomarina maritima]MRJ42903.1 oligoribonuclease [Idiomarina sp. FeN1]NCU58454.1 oligoribonuclease [Idiomarina sp. FenA--70]NCU61151.1 oligoribonuclease [Idiomarina sp. FenBw--71]
MSAAARLIWIDLEMTGLEPDHDHIIEIATIITDYQLNVLAEGPVLAVYQPPAHLAKMDDWNVRTHTGSGLVQRVQESTLDDAAAEQATIEFLQQWVTPGTSPMCGNSIGQDRRFLARHMPKLEQFFHYRNLDVSTVKQLAKYWAPDVAAGLTKQGAHTALADIRESIEELKYYREHFFKLPE